MRYCLSTFILLLPLLLFSQNTYFPKITSEDVFQSGDKSTPIEPDSLLYLLDDQYTLNKGDKISIIVMDHIEFTRDDILVLPDGHIEYPLLGSIKVAGLTSGELSAIIKEKLRPYVTIPVVTIYIDRIYGQKINIIGYVNQAGEYQIFEPIRITDALAMAKGIVNIRLISTIRIVRENGDVFNVNIKKIWFSHSDQLVLEDQILIYPGDTVIIPPPKVFNWQLYTAFISTLAFALQLYLAFQ